MKVWQWREGKLLGSRQIGKPLDSTREGAGAEEGGGGEEPKLMAAVTKVCCSSAQEDPLVLVAVERSVTSRTYREMTNSPSTSCSQMECFLLSADGSLCEWGSIQLPVTPWDLAFDWSDNLWVCLDLQPHPLLCFQQKEGKVTHPSATLIRSIYSLFSY